jgi:acetyltransferase
MSKLLFPPESLDAIFRPKSIAVIGATPRPGTIGRQIMHNLITYEFNGKIFPVNPKHEVIHSIKCYPTVADIPDPVSMAFVIVPRDVILETIDECAAQGIKGVVVITAGFKEVGEEGAALEARLLSRLEQHGMRMVGPNCFGIVNTDPAYRVNGTFGKTKPLEGKIALVSQSGALGETIFTHAAQLEVGFSMFASIGNKTDVSGNDMLLYWRDDPKTEIILMYLENFGDPRRFTQIAREITRKKPIIVVKAGRTAAGARAALSHTGALAGQDVSVDALFEQTGVIRVSSIQEMFDVATALAVQPVPRGRRVCVVTNAGGPGILATDALVASGLEMAPLSAATKDELRRHLPRQAAVDNPVDLIASADAERYALALEVITRDDAVDSVVPLFVPPLMINADAVAQRIVEVAEKHRKPMLPCMMGVAQGAPWIARLKAAGLPIYPYPEAIAQTLAAMDRWRRWLERPQGRIPDFDTHIAATSRLLDASEGRPLKGADAMALLATQGIPVVPLRLAAGVDEAVAAAEACGFPVVLKLESPDVLHKSDVGGVRLDLRTPDDVRDGFEAIRDSLRRHDPRATFAGVHVQAMVSDGTELVIGMTTDRSFGPLVMFGMGGVFVEVLNDVAFRVHPLSDVDAREMIADIRGYPLLQGARGRRKVDIDRLAEIILRVSHLVTHFPGIDQIDINPLVAGSERFEFAAVDARIIPVVHDSRSEAPAVGTRSAV